MVRLAVGFWTASAAARGVQVSAVVRENALVRLHGGEVGQESRGVGSRLVMLLVIGVGSESRNERSVVDADVVVPVNAVAWAGSDVVVTLSGSENILVFGHPVCHHPFHVAYHHNPFHVAYHHDIFHVVCHHSLDHHLDLRILQIVHDCRTSFLLEFSVGCQPVVPRASCHGISPHQAHE